MNKKNEKTDLSTNQPVTWCPGCTNFLLKQAVQKAMEELIEDGRNNIEKEDFVSVVGIGCAPKIYDYLDISGINSLHGRVLPTCLGVKMGNPNLKVIGFAGDGGTYNEGIGHLIHAGRNNSDFNMIVHDNQIFALTTGQATSTTEKGFKEKTRPEGVREKPINPLVLALESGATFVARLNIFDIEKTKKILKKSIMHKGFSFIEALQPCIQFHNSSDYIRDNSYYIETGDFNEALEKAKEWKYDKKGKIPVGIFYNKEKKTFEEKRDLLKEKMDKNTGFYSRNRKRKALKDF
ncbi:MAG: thiamine pyrophosphate-dependent enzyme [Candidatus Woesearchaeota archaeon]